MTDPIRVLLIDDDEDEVVLDRHLLAESRMSRVSLDWTPDYDAALDDMASHQHDVYLLDYRMGAHDGLELLREALARGCFAPVVMLTGQGDGEVDLAAMRAGAADYLVKGRISGELLERALRHAVERKRIEKQLAHQREEFRGDVDPRHQEPFARCHRLRGHAARGNEEHRKPPRAGADSESHR